MAAEHRGRDPLEAALAILIAFSAGLSGMAGFLSADAKNMETRARGLSQKELSLANTAYLSANQIFILDINSMREANVYEYLADVNGDEKYREIANYMRNTTVIVIEGFLTYEGDGAAEYAGNYSAALAAYSDFIYSDYHEHLQASENATADAQHHAQMSSNYLLTTVFMAFSGVLATIGITASVWKTRIFVGGLVCVVMGITSVFIVATMLS